MKLICMTAMENAFFFLHREGVLNINQSNGDSLLSFNRAQCLQSTFLLRRCEKALLKCTKLKK